MRNVVTTVEREVALALGIEAIIRVLLSVEQNAIRFRARADRPIIYGLVGYVAFPPQLSFVLY